MRPITTKEGLIDVEEEAREAVRSRWARYPDAAAFTKRHLPTIWYQIEACSMNFMRWTDNDDNWTIDPIYCHAKPWCITCTRASATRRTMRILSQFLEATPYGESPRLQHIVQTAATDKDTTGHGKGNRWGHEVKDLKGVQRFQGVVWDTIQGRTGKGSGGILSFHAFGEKPLKNHPHVDMTLNGWMVKHGKPAPTPEIELQGGGYEELQRELATRAAKEFEGDVEGNLNIGHLAEDAKSYWRILNYQVRELVDVRKIQYDLEAKTVTWESYHDPPGEWATYPVHDFLAGIASYQWRFKQWPGRGERGGELHRGFGCMAASQLGKTEKAMGSLPTPHPDECGCRKCHDWFVVGKSPGGETLNSATSR